MAHWLDYPIQQLREILEAPFSVSEGFRPVRDAARNIVYRYAEDSFKERFRSQTTFKSIYDIRTDEEKYRLILKAIRNAIHYFEVWQVREQQRQSIGQPSSETNSEPVVQTINAQNVFQNMNSTVVEQSGVAEKAEPSVKSNMLKLVAWMLGSLLILILGAYLFFGL
ncbi:hypothetical protein ACFQ21_05135 [Ohtaekwangia kribbensis]|uniref:Uncharacterized protein n=1 Tax=Ohtaekwangia kribbensis TaxID=688913 RepID=A0ABW3JXV0_9BACT